MTNITSIALSASIALSTFSAPAIADDLDDVLRIIGNIFPAHHSHRILVCDDDDDDGGGCYYLRRGHTGHVYGYSDDDDDGGRWRGYDDDDDDGGGWNDDDD